MISDNEDTFSVIPDVIFDYWMRILSPNQFMVLMAILRHRWNEMNSDRIKMATGIQDINRDIRNLLQLKIINYEATSNIKGDVYTINIKGLYDIDNGCKEELMPSAFEEVAKDEGRKVKIFKEYSGMLKNLADR